MTPSSDSIYLFITFWHPTFINICLRSSLGHHRHHLPRNAGAVASGAQPAAQHAPRQRNQFEKAHHCCCCFRPRLCYRLACSVAAYHCCSWWRPVCGAKKPRGRARGIVQHTRPCKRGIHKHARGSTRAHARSAPKAHSGTRHTAREEIWSPLPTLISLALARDARAHTIYARTIQYALTRHAHTHTHSHTHICLVGAAADTPSTRSGPRCDGGKRACTTRPQQKREGVTRHADNKERRAAPHKQTTTQKRNTDERARLTIRQGRPDKKRERPPADSMKFFRRRRLSGRQLVKHGGERSSVVLRFYARVRRTCNAR